MGVFSLVSMTMVITLASVAVQPKSRVVASDVNLALGKATSQSGTQHSGKSQNTVDGDKNPTFFQYSCSHTDYLPITWLQVDLSTSYVITGLEITNRESLAERLNNLTIEVTSSDPSTLPGFPGLTSSPVCERRVDPIPASVSLKLECWRPIRGRYLRVIKYSDSDARDDYPLSICELEIYGKTEWRLTRQPQTDGTAEVLETVPGITSRVQCAVRCVGQYPCLYVQIRRRDGVCRLLTSFQASGGLDPTVEWDLFAIDLSW